MSTEETAQCPHVVVVGAGLAGLSAAIEAQRGGARVTILEKTERVGGNSSKATSGINGTHSAPQVERGILDSSTALKEDTIRSGGGLSDQALVEVLAKGATEVIPWLNAFGLSLTALSQCGGHSAPRTHRLAPTPDGKPLPVGFTIMKVLGAYCAQSPDIEVISGAQVKQLLVKDTEDGREKQVCGCVYITHGRPDEPVQLLSDAVVVATGGYAYDRGEHSLLREYCPEFCHLPTSSGPQAEGDGVKLCRSAGAALIDMDQVQIHPTGLVNLNDTGNLNKFLGPEALRGCGGILVNGRGERFVNELDTRDHVTARIFEQCQPLAGQPLASGADQITAYMLLNEEAAESFGKATLQFYASKGMFTRCDNLHAVARQFGMNEETLSAAVTTYVASAKAGRDEFGKAVFPVKDWSVDSPVYAALVTPVIHYTMGGVKITASAEVLRRRTDGSFAPMLGLFAAGEVTGGVHGRNRLAGNSLLECVVFGRAAGRRAADIQRTSQMSVNPHEWTPLRLRSKQCLSGSVFEFSFELPSPFDVVPLNPGQAVSVRAVLNGEECIRYYSPISRTNQAGHLDLLIKVKPEHGMMSRHLFFLQPGDTLEFKGPVGGFDFSVTDGSVKKVALLAGGVGISPMIQVIRHVLHSDAPTDLTLLWGCEDTSDIVLKEKLDRMQELHRNLKVVYYLEHPPTHEPWTGEVGFIDQQAIEKYVYPPGDDIRIIICGPYRMCQALKATLKEMGYSDHMVFSYM